jgi:soluble lytic murein transglycosylase-like protein
VARRRRAANYVARGAVRTAYRSAPSSGDAEIDQLILDSSARHGVDPRLVLAVVRQESGFHRTARSPKGACGLMQLMPSTARRFGVTDIFDPRQNIDAGVRYLRLLLDMFSNRVDLALASYNAGEYRVIREGYRVPQIPETVNYVRAISADYSALVRAPRPREGDR